MSYARRVGCHKKSWRKYLLYVQQPSIAKLERRTDMYLSTLRSHIEAMGGELDIIARFPDGPVKISNFSELEHVVHAE